MAVARRGVWTALVALVCALGLLAGAGRALAEEAKFAYTGKEQEFKVPAGVTSVKVMAVGGKGGGGGGAEPPGGGGSGGFGALVEAQLPVTPGHTLYVEVGSNGCENFLPGCTESVFGGGGAPSAGNGSGGGASDVREKPLAEGEESLKSRLLVAGGGGGGGGLGGLGTQAGGAGGDANAKSLGAGGDGENGTSGSANAQVGEGGKGATSSEGGKGGKGGSGATKTGGSGAMGTLGAGGSGGNDGGGGGGGGRYGGGGGGGGGFDLTTIEDGDSGGGGAGSSFVAASGSNPTFATDTTGTPNVRITWGKQPTTLKTSLSGEGKSGEQITVDFDTYVTDQATLSGENAAEAEGTVTYRLYTDSECKKLDSEAGEVKVSKGSVPASGPINRRAGTYYWQAEYSGDEQNERSKSKCGAEVLTVVPAPTSTSTTLSGEGQSGESITVTEGASVSDTATLTTATAEAEGTVTYSIYSDEKCEKLVKQASTVLVSSSSAPPSESETLTAGTYYWLASYSGDENNRSSATKCGAEVLTVLPAQKPTTLKTSLSGEGQAGEKIAVKEGTSVTDHATLSGENASKATGEAEYKLYTDSECTKLLTSAGTVKVSAGVVPESAPRNLPAGTYYWQAEYSGDAHNKGSKSECGAEILTVLKPATCGRTSIGKITDQLLANLKRVNRCVLPAAKLYELTEYLTPTYVKGQELVKGVIYGETKGKPGALLGTTEQLTFKNTNAAGWYHLAFKTPLTLKAGTYWIGVITGGTSKVAAEHYEPVYNAEDYNSNYYNSGPSNPFGSFKTTNEQVSLYATYVPAGPEFTIEKSQTIENSSEGSTKEQLTGKVGQTVDYAVLVTNTGNTPLTLTNFKDPNCEGASGNPEGSIVPGEAYGYTCHHILTSTGKYENSATVTGTPPEGEGEPFTHTSNTVVVNVLREVR